MSERPELQPPQPTRSLKHLGILIGKWAMLGTHPAFPSAAYGSSTFEWLAEDALLIWHFDWEEPGPPSAVSVIGRDDSADACCVLYSDERGVGRIYQMKLEGSVWKMWRESTGFSQQMTGTFSDDAKTISVHGQLSHDGSNWEQDLDVTYSRQK
ncbi:MAG TPA: hypothetical protein VK606_03805 [Verrucomicrobiae bacterium]|nr:hypothetical protein [Verrucomicrobiae bacterium]